MFKKIISKSLNAYNTHSVSIQLDRNFSILRYELYAFDFFELLQKMCSVTTVSSSPHAAPGVTARLMLCGEYMEQITFLNIIDFVFVCSSVATKMFQSTK